MKNIVYKTHNYSIPFEITCTISGLTKVYTSEEYINGKIEKAGSLELLKANYVCRDAAKLKKQGKTNEEIRAHFQNPVAVAATIVPAINTTIPVVVAEVKPEVQEEVKELPIAKQDSKGKWRTAKGYLISEFNLKNYKQVVVEKVA